MVESTAFNRSVPVFPDQDVPMNLVHTIDVYDGLVTMGIFIAHNGQRYFRYWMGESIAEGWVKFAFVQVSNEQVRQIMEGKLDLALLLLNNLSDIFTYSLSLGGDALIVSHAKVHIERGRQLKPGEVPRGPCFFEVETE